MGASLGHLNHVTFFCCQDYRDALLEFRRLRTHIHDHIVNCSLGAAYQLGLGIWRGLIMYASQRSFSRVERQAALHQPRVEPMSVEFLLAPCARKETTLVWFRFGVNFEDVWEARVKKNHHGSY